MNDLQKAPELASKWKPFLVFLVGIGLVSIGLLTWSWLTRTAISPTVDQKIGQVKPMPTRLEQSAAAGQDVPKMPKEPSTVLRAQLEQVLSGIKEAHQKKDLSQLLSHYSPNFPQLPQRAQSISKDWKVYDYPKMEFEIKMVRLLPDNSAEVKVTWNVEAQNISTKKIKNVSKSYLTKFVKESGQWRIKALDQTE